MSLGEGRGEVGERRGWDDGGGRWPGDVMEGQPTMEHQYPHFLLGRGLWLWLRWPLLLLVVDGSLCRRSGSC